MQQRFNRVLTRLLGLQPPPAIALSVSGGVDSMALASLTKTWAKTHAENTVLHGLVIDHGLRPTSGEESAQTAENLEKMGIVLHKLALNLAGTPETRTEAVARTKRIALLRQKCSDLGTNYLFYGHHRDDQYETFIMRALQNSSWYGLAGMHAVSVLDPTSKAPEKRDGPSEWVSSVRPLLDFRKSELRELCTSRDVQWFEDATNGDPSLTIRNAIRKLSTEYEPLLPKHLQKPFVWDLQVQLAQRRQRADHEAQCLYRLLMRDKSLVLDDRLGAVRLKMTPELLDLNTDSQVSFLMLLLTYATPLPVRDLAYRRSVVLDFVLGGYQKKVIADVVFSVRQGYLHLKRSLLRRTNLKTRAVNNLHNVQLFTATHEWSDWHFIDNRFWMRWKLPTRDTAPKRHIAVHMNQGDFIDRVINMLESESLGKINREQAATQPFFTFTDPMESANVIGEKDIIGYPMLNRYTNLLVQWRYKDRAI